MIVFDFDSVNPVDPSDVFAATVDPSDTFQSTAFANQSASSSA